MHRELGSIRTEGQSKRPSVSSFSLTCRVVGPCPVGYGSCGKFRNGPAQNGSRRPRLSQVENAVTYIQLLRNASRATCGACGISGLLQKVNIDASDLAAGQVSALSLP